MADGRCAGASLSPASAVDAVAEVMAAEGSVSEQSFERKHLLER